MKTPPAKPVPSKLLKAYLAETGWTQLRLARLAGLNDGFVNRIIKGKQGVSLYAALALERASKLALQEGLTTAKPLQAIELVPEWADVLAPLPGTAA